MFSPLNLEINASLGFRFCSLACSVVALCALVYSGLNDALVALILIVWAALTFSLVLPRLSVSQIVWDLDRLSMKLLCKDKGWVSALRIEKIHLLPGVCFFKVIPVSGSCIYICVFPDSMSKNDYRRLKVALSLGKLSFAATEATHS